MIDLRSDTVTKPTEAMRDAMAHAPVGDDVYGEDPTVNRLQEIAAALVGKPAALFVPSGIMANQLAIRGQTQPGDEVIVESRAHIVRYEHGAASALAGVQLHWITGNRGILTPEQIEAAINERTKLVFLASPNNPTGNLVTSQQLVRLLRTGVLVVLDEAYF
ncbi:MAG: low specificity L-threonine aldolase, partial [Nitrospiraceae bacterium]